MKFYAITKVKPQIKDIEGETLEKAIKYIGLADIKNFRVGRYFEFEAENKDEAQKIVDEFLLNPAVEMCELHEVKS